MAAIAPQAARSTRRSMSEYPVVSGDPSVLRRLNLQAVLRVLHSGGVHTITDLAGRAKLSRPTTKQAIDDLVAGGWVSPVAPDRQGTVIGRPAQSFEFRPDAGHVLAADIGGYKAVAVVADLNGDVLARSRLELEPTWSAERRLEALGEAIHAALSQFPAGATAISDAAIATPGTVDPGGTVVFNRTIPGWHGQNLGEWVTERYPFHAEAVSDMPMAALAEHWRGAAQSVSNILYLHAGRRLGAAALIGGRPHNGSHGAATQLGLWRGLPWREDYAELMHLDRPSGGDGARAVFEAAALGDTDAQARIDTFVDEMVTGIMPMLIAIDPEMLVIGGGVSAAGEALAGPVRERVKAETLFPPTVVCSSLGDEAVTIGALRLALDRAEDRLFASLGQAS